VRLAARRFIDDLKRSQGARPPFYFSARTANNFCLFIENLPHIEGTWDTATLRLEPPQIFFVVNLFGFRSLDGGRRFEEALLCIARKNAKSTLAAAILLAVLCLEPENGAQVISAATTGSQARIVWKVAKAMIDRTPELREHFGLEAFANLISREETGGIYRPINSKASTQDGLNPSAIGLDEIHAHKTHDLVNVLRSAAGARRNLLILYTTTEGYESPGPWPEIRNFARDVLRRLYRADHFFALIFALDDEDPEEAEFTERYWIKANPLMPCNPIILKEMRKLAIGARTMPGTHAEFRIKRLNRPAAGANTWINLTKWRKCAGEIPLDRLIGAPCAGAFDLANTMDMNAWALLFLVEGEFYARLRYWVPADAVAQRTERRTVPYAGWIRAGWITQTPGDTTDYSVIERDILEDCALYSPPKVGFDPWNATATASNLANQGVPLEQFIQGPRSYNPAMRALELAYTSGRFHHGGNPVLQWNAANLVPRRDVNLNLAPDRKRSADKIDGMCALLMAFGLLASDDSQAFDRFLDNVVSA
jgi:phage terminase large subunit-like protein